MMHIEAIAIKFYRVNGGSHTPVTLAVAAINLLWLFPIAYITVTQPWAYPELAVLIADLPF